MRYQYIKNHLDYAFFPQFRVYEEDQADELHGKYISEVFLIET